MSTRWVGVVAIVASMAGSAAADGPGPEPVDVEGVVAPRRLVPAPTPIPPRTPADLPTTSLAWMDPTRAAVGVDAMAREEVRSRLQEMGVSVAWRRSEPGEIGRPGEVRVILLDRGAVRASGEHILGAVPSHFEGEPYVWVHVPNVRAVMGLPPQGPLAAVDASSVRAFGIALGRVIAHELVHVLAPSAPHGKGLMSERLGPFLLTASRLQLDPAVSLAVRASLRGEPSLPPAGADVLAATAAGKAVKR